MTYPRVRHSHVVARGYLAGWAVDGKLEMRLLGESASKPISPRDAAVRSDFYRRQRPDGSRIDDVEWTLSNLESATLPALRRVRELWPLPLEEKAKLAQLFGNQVVRGPLWRDWYEKTTRAFVERRVSEEQMPVPSDDRPPTDEEVASLERYMIGDTARTTRMLSGGLKVASLLGSMHWSLIEFHTPLLATSDHPVVPWPLDDRSRQPQPFSFDIGLFETLEIRVPVSPFLAIVMTWLDDEDQPEVVRGTRELAANLNAFTVAQAERQWFHRPGRVSPRESGQLLPLSSSLLERYDSRAAERSGRRRVISQKVKEMVEVDLAQTDIELVTVSRP
jgi:hypothetical protein